MRFFDVVEYPGNIRTAMIPTNKELHHGQMHLSVGGRDIIVRSEERRVGKECVP